MLVSNICKHCSIQFEREKHDIVRRTIKGKGIFCSKTCFDKHNKASHAVITTCLQCGASICRAQSTIVKSGNAFCNHSCSAKYSNTHKIKGNRRSKLEIWLESQIPALYPNLEFVFNKKDAINSELDIFIPSLKLAFELNGILHYESIYGSEKLSQIQNNDGRKFQACLERGIELCIIDTSAHKYVTPKTSQKYLDLIRSIIDLKIGAGN